MFSAFQHDSLQASEKYSGVHYILFKDNLATISQFHLITEPDRFMRWARAVNVILRNEVCPFMWYQKLEVRTIHKILNVGTPQGIQRYI